MPESLACGLQAQAEGEAGDADTAEAGGQEATAGSTGGIEQQQDGTGTGAGQAAQGELLADSFQPHWLRHVLCSPHADHSAVMGWLLKLQLVTACWPGPQT